MLMQIFSVLVIVATLATFVTAQLSLPGCPDSCGNITIPYPFGTKQGCYLNENFLISCNDTDKPFLRVSDLPVLSISLNSELRVTFKVSYDCYDTKGNPTGAFSEGVFLKDFNFSYTKNKFTAVGCDTTAYLKDAEGRRYATGCMSQCFSMEDVESASESCSGIGCCQTSIPKNVKDFGITIESSNNHKNVSDFNKCSYAFLVEDGGYNFTSSDLKNLRGIERFPVVFDWRIGNKTCEDAKQNLELYTCKSEYSFCDDSDHKAGYRCTCYDGYRGNPYLSNGCQDINECEDLLTPHNCESTKFCYNNPGNFTCLCPKGYHGDGRKDGKGCIENQYAWPKIVVGVSVGFLVLLLCISWSYWLFRQRKIINLRERFFEQNGGILLSQHLLQHQPSKKTRVFSEKELRKATNNYHQNRFLGQGGQGTVYKGILKNNREVAIKKAKLGDQNQIEQFINEVIVLSEVNHRNVVKLLGCCLETETPLLVYEFVNNGTLFDRMHDFSDTKSTIPWETRLKIVTETADALSYLHSAASIPIIHRDIKSANILLEENYTAKVSDFGASRLIPMDKAQLTTLVQGTLGYLDPEYYHTSQLTEKSDVYSFGVVLLEMVSGEKALSFDRRERHLVTYFISAINESRLLEVLDKRVLDASNVKQLEDVSKLAMECVRMKGEDRPTMKEVAMELDRLRVMVKGFGALENLSFKEADYLLGGDNRGSTEVYDSMNNQVELEIQGSGR